MTSTTLGTDTLERAATRERVPATRDDLTHLTTSLFSGSVGTADAAARARADAVTPASAFQDALYGRALVGDIRPLAERVLAGGVDTALFPVLVLEANSPATLWSVALSTYLAALDHPNVPVHVLGSTAGQADAVVARLRGLGMPAHRISGEFAGWRSAGMPVRSVATA